MKTTNGIEFSKQRLSPPFERITTKKWSNILINKKIVRKSLVDLMENLFKEKIIGKQLVEIMA